MDIHGWLQLTTVGVGFVAGVAMVHRFSRRVPVRARPPVQRATLLREVRPAQQLEIRGVDGLLDGCGLRSLLASIERKTRFSQAGFERDCLPMVQAVAEFVQMLPASESHHHAQPGGLLIHVLEVADAALTFRAGMELPPGAGTEERKRLEHRWTYAVFCAALLHDIGKPVTDFEVTLFGADPRLGKRWSALAGPMTAFGSGWYSVGFADAEQRDYRAHSKLSAMLLHRFMQPRLMQWLAEDGDVLAQLLAYLAGEDPNGLLGSIIKRADSDSVQKNLLQGPRTRFSTARTRPLIERLMEALQRMLHEGSSLPLNRAGAAGWVHDGKVWFVCARLADEVRSYLAQHESAAGVPGKDKNDRLFDVWQEFGAALPAPDGGAVWRVLIDCDGWSPPDPLTVLCFGLEKLYADPSRYPSAMRGSVRPVAGTGTAAARAVAAPAVPATAKPVPAVEPNFGRPLPVAQARAADPVLVPVPVPVPVPVIPPEFAPTAPTVSVPTGASPELRPNPQPATPRVQGPMPARVEPAPDSSNADDDDVLPASESALADLAVPARAQPAAELGSPLRPKPKGERPEGSRPGPKGPSPAATAFMAWVAHCVGTGELKYNEDGALVHFAAEGALLLSPEIFRRFLAEHAAVPEGPVAALRASHGERAFARLQNEFAKSGWTSRNGDENLHYYAFVKADKGLSRPASFYLLPKPATFWNPVPPPNDRIQRVTVAKKLALPADNARRPVAAGASA